MKLPCVHTPHTPSNAPAHFCRAPDAQGSHARQLDAPVAFWKRPVAHGVHSWAVALTKVPGWHTGQTPAKAPPHASRGPLSHVPHGLHFDAPVPSWYWPAAHGVHSWAVALTTVPGGHVGQ